MGGAPGCRGWLGSRGAPPRRAAAGSWKQIDLPKPVESTTRLSRPSSVACTAATCSGLRRSNPQCSLSVASRSAQVWPLAKATPPKPSRVDVASLMFKIRELWASQAPVERARRGQPARFVLALGEAPRTLGDARRRLATLWRRCATVARRFPQTLGLAVLFRICTRRGRQANTDPTTQARTQDTGLHNGRQAPQEEQEAAHLRRVVVRVARRVGRHTCCSGHDAGGHTSFCSVAGGRPATRGRPTTHTHGGFAAAPRVHGVP